jgi:hypothetical protein
LKLTTSVDTAEHCLPRSASHYPGLSPAVQRQFLSRRCISIGIAWSKIKDFQSQGLRSSRSGGRSHCIQYNTAEELKMTRHTTKQLRGQELVCAVDGRVSKLPRQVNGANGGRSSGNITNRRIARLGIAPCKIAGLPRFGCLLRSWKETRCQQNFKSLFDDDVDNVEAVFDSSRDEGTMETST